MSSRKPPKRKPEPDRLPPNNPDAERAVLSCIIQNPACLAECKERIQSMDAFYDLRHRCVWSALMKFENPMEIDVITLQSYLLKSGTFEQVGGITFLMEVADFAPSAANYAYHLDIMLDMFERRKYIGLCQEITERSFNFEGSIDELRYANQSDLQAISELASHEHHSSAPLSFSAGLEYDTSHDPNAVLGVVDGKTTRWLCRGQGSWVIAPSGIGKSVLLYQMGCLFALGRSLFGIAPVKPLRILIMQAENDTGDLAEMVQGAAAALGADVMSPDVEQLDKNLLLLTERQSTGQQFCRHLGRQIEKFQADLVMVDPLLSFAGIDVSRQDQCSNFLRNWINPMLASTGAALIGAHHTGKPRPPKEMRGMTPVDFAYQGLGSSELVNWARAISVIIPHGEVYELKLLKRGARAAATHPDGTPTTSVWLRHSFGKLWWEQADAPIEQEPVKAARGGAPSKVNAVLAIGLGRLIDGLTTPTSKNELAKSIEVYAAKGTEQGKLDVSLSTCKTVVEKLVSNGAIKKNADGMYVKP